MIGRFIFHAQPVIVFGRGSCNEVGSFLEKYGAGGSILLVCGPNVQRHGLDVSVVRSIEEKSFSLRRFDKIESDAPLSLIREGVKYAREEKVTAVVGMGGGSALDTAKAIALLLSNNKDILEYVQDGADSFPNRRQIPFIAIPTTCGTGSEITDGGVVLDEESHHKYVYWDMFGAPDVALVDPDMLDNIPAGLLTSTSMDALSHSVEAFTSRGANPISDAVALRSITLIRENLPNAQKGDTEAKEMVMLASTLAGMAFNRSGVHVGHCIAHALGAVCSMHHGTACAIATPYVIRTQASSIPERIAELAKAFSVSDLDGESLATAIEEFNCSLGIGTLSGYGVKMEQLDAVVKYASAEPIQKRAYETIDPQNLLAYLKSCL